MRSIRTRLLLSIGSLFLIIAILNYSIPHIFVSKDINAASAYLTTIYSQYQARLKQLSSSWVIYRFVNEAAKLDISSQTLSVSEKPLWELAADAVGQDPEIALVQVTNKKGETAVISPESGHLYLPRWTKDHEGRLWIEIPEKEKIFLASALKKDKGAYLLYGEQEDEEDARNLDFTPFEAAASLDVSESEPNKIYAALRAKESAQLEKIKMIQELAQFEGHADGILHVDNAFKKAKALLADEILSKNQVVAIADPNPKPFILYRKSGPYVDLMQFATETAPYIIIGYSLSSIGSEIARTVHKPVMLYNKGAPLQAFTPEGVSVPFSDFTHNDDKILFDNIAYSASNIAIGPLSIFSPHS